MENTSRSYRSRASDVCSTNRSIFIRGLGFKNDIGEVRTVIRFLEYSFSEHRGEGTHDSADECERHQR